MRLFRRFLDLWQCFRIAIGILGLNPRSFWRLFNLDRILFYRTQSIDKVLAYSRLPDGCFAVHFWDSLPTLDLVYFHEIYEKFRKISRKDVVIDCGAHVGIFTLKAAREAEQGLVIAVEPETLNHKILELNVKNNKLTNVVVCKIALMEDESKRTKLYLHDLSEGHSLKITFREDTGSDSRGAPRALIVQSTTLDNLARIFEPNGADFIKMSVNGAELDVIRGGRRLLQASGYLAIEYNKQQTKVSELADLLSKLGFKKVSEMDRPSSNLGFIYFAAPARMAYSDVQLLGMSSLQADSLSN